MKITTATDMSHGIPFTTEQFFQVFEKYNQAIYPIQFGLILIAVVMIALAASRNALFVSDVNDKAHWVEVGRCYERFLCEPAC
jgi:Family of unknown function (DUF6064)